MRYHPYVFLIIILVLMSCKQQIKEQSPEVTVSMLQDVTSPAGASSSLPHLVSNSDVTLLSWVETEGDTLTKFYFSKLVDGTWQKPESILQGTDWFVNWADYPMIAENKGNYLSHILKKSTEGAYSYDVKINLRPKESSEWQTEMPLHTDGTPTEHGFVTVLPYKNAFFVTWLDGRNTEENEAGNRGAMTLRAAEVATDGKVTEEKELDIRTCDCCQTTATITTNGPVVLYRDRSEEEVRDISIVRRVDGKWTAPKTIHTDGWKIKGCPVNGPKVASLGNNLVAAWFTAAQEKAKVQVVFSQDGGAHFQEPILIAQGNVMGRVDVVWIDEETVVVSWMESEGKTARLQLAKVSTNGTVSQKLTLLEMAGSRQAGFPQLEKVDGMLYFAWTEIAEKESRVRTAKLDLDLL